MRILQHKAKELKAYAYQGFIMGSLVGGSFGTIIGIWQAVQTRRLIVIPLSALMSGCAFGFFMACGTMIRSDEPLNHPDFQPFNWSEKFPKEE